MRNFKTTIALIILITINSPYAINSEIKLTANQELTLIKTLDKQKTILQTVSSLPSEQVPSEILINDYQKQEDLLKKYEATGSPTIIKFINDKRIEIHNSIPNVAVAIQKIQKIKPIINIIHKTTPQLSKETHHPRVINTPKTEPAFYKPLQILPQLSTEKEDLPLIMTATKTIPTAGTALKAMPQLLIKKEQPVTITELKEQFAQLEKKIAQELKKDENIQLPVPAPVSRKQNPSKQLSVSQEEQKELESRLTQLEIDLYKKFYYNHTKELLTQEGIKDIIKTIQKDQPTIATAQLITIAHEKSIEILKNIKKQNQLDAQSKLLLLNMINSTVDQQQNKTKNSPKKAPIFTPALKELETKRPMIEYHEITPTSFTSTITSIIAPATETAEIVDKSIVAQEHSSPLLSENLINFVEYSKKQASNYYYSGGIIRQDWLIKAIGHILNGMLTKDKKEDVVQKLFAMIDILIAAPLRDDTSITDAEYAKIIAKLEDQIKKFVDSLAVDKIYRPRN